MTYNRTLLKICWKINPQTGDSNFDIDDENIDPNNPFLFSEMNKSTKLKSFEKWLENEIKNRKLKTNIDVYMFAFDIGVLPKHANEVLNKMIKDGVLEKGFEMKSSDIHRVKKMNLVLKK